MSLFESRLLGRVKYNAYIILCNIYGHILYAKQTVVMDFMIITSTIHVKGPVSLKIVKHKDAGSAVQAVHCTTPRGTTPWGTFSHEYGNPASIEPEVRQDMEQMFSDDEAGRLMKGVREKQKQCWYCCS